VSSNLDFQVQSVGGAPPGGAAEAGGAVQWPSAQMSFPGQSESLAHGGPVCFGTSGLTHCPFSQMRSPLHSVSLRHPGAGAGGDAALGCAGAPG